MLSYSTMMVKKRSSVFMTRSVEKNLLLLLLLLFLLLLLLLPLYNITTHYSFLHYCFSSSSSSYDGDECYSTHGSHISTHDNESMLYSSREIEQSHHHPHPHDEHEHEDDSHTNTSNSNSSTTIQSLLNMENDPLQLIDFTVGKIRMLCLFYCSSSTYIHTYIHVHTYTHTHSCMHA